MHFSCLQRQVIKVSSHEWRMLSRRLSMLSSPLGTLSCLAKSPYLVLFFLLLYSSKRFQQLAPGFPLWTGKFFTTRASLDSDTSSATTCSTDFAVMNVFGELIKTAGPAAKSTPKGSSFQNCTVLIAWVSSLLRLVIKSAFVPTGSL